MDFTLKMNNQHPWQLKESKSLELSWSYKVNNTANLAQFRDKWAGLAFLFSDYLLNGSQDFHFFNCSGCRILILCEIHCYVCPHIFGIYYFSLSQCDLLFRDHGRNSYNIFITILENQCLHKFILSLSDLYWTEN